MNTAFYIKCLPRKKLERAVRDPVTGEYLNKYKSYLSDYRPVIYNHNDELVPLSNEYKAVLYKESASGRIMKPVGRDPLRLGKYYYGDKDTYDKERGSQIPNFYQSLFLHNPTLCTTHKMTRPLKMMYFDIETITLGNGKFPDPFDYHNKYPICMLGYKINDEKPIVLEFNYRAYCNGHAESDIELIGEFITVLSRENPDVIVGYNSYEFDIPYIAARCSVMDKARQKRMKGQLWTALMDSLIRKEPSNEDEREALRYYMGERTMYLDRRNPNSKIVRPTDAGDLCGRIHYDIYTVDVVGDQTLSGIKDKKMKTLAKHHKLINVIEVGDNIANTLALFKNDKELLRAYQVSDVEITKGLCDRYFPLNITLAEMLNVPLSFLTEKGRGTVANTYIIREELANGMIPLEGNDDYRRHDALYHLGRTYQGAIVGIMKEGQMLINKDENAHIYLRNSWKQDFKSMYPSAAVQFNLGPDTTRLIYDYENPNWYSDFSDPYCKQPQKTLERVILPRWIAPNGDACAEDACPSQEMWIQYEAYLKETDPEEHARKFGTRFCHYRDNVGLKYLDIYFPDSRLNAIIHLRVTMEREGFLRRKLLELFKQRKTYKDLMKNKEATPEQISGYNSNQNAIKVVMNSIYGVSGNERGSADIALAIGITGLCRYCTNAVIKYINEKYNNAVVEVDTDGLIVKEDIDPEEINVFLSKKISDDTGLDLGNHMIMEKEVFDRMYIYRMKNYILREEDGSITKHGVTMKASSHHKMYDECIEDVSNFVLSDAFYGKEELESGSLTPLKLKAYEDKYDELKQKYTKDVWDRPIEDFVKKAKLTKNPDHYLRSSAYGMHAQMILLSREIGIEPQKDSTIYYVHITDPETPNRKYNLYVDGDNARNTKLLTCLDKTRYLSDVTKIFARFNIETTIKDDVNFI